MPKYTYVAMDAHGKESKGTLEVASQNEAISRVKDMGLFPTKIVEVDKAKAKPDKKSAPAAKSGAKKGGKGLNVNINIKIPGLGGRVKSKVLTTFTRQLATLVDAGLPLLRGLRVLEKQERNATLKGIINELAIAIEGGSTFSEGLAQHPKVFNRLFVNMVKAGELGGVLEVVLNRLSEFMEKAQKIKGKVVAAMFYPVAVLVVAVIILSILMVYVIPKFKEVFAGMLEGAQLPAFTRFVLAISDTIREHFVATLSILGGFVVLLMLFIRTKFGRRVFDKFKLKMPVVGPVINKVAISRFTRTLGTLVSSGVPILQALTIVKETAGNVIIANAVAAVHENVKEGETITAPLEASGVFPPMVISMVDVGEQTGALPEMLLKIADTYDDEVDNAVAAMTSLLEPIMIIFLAVIVGSIVIAMFLPLIELMNKVGSEGGGGGKDE
ncbi:MAG TPA: type II secretion system F family protein [Verrucomicrobiota bacterium]|jgi:type IV pilus assembly protein PilC|nr:type II secretion system F family protein [Verrucomicrobiota bacterium]HCL91637.1 pilus assembly protein PilC [Limisphaerales bacterium]HRR65369.1 type II secretion system F family protein [Candidatus Paceibacterota bacterium]HNR70665.1 type II secretion system F family protein [Verrucomicrobiota bacterium]HNS68964.1 type II secretion system F family protein [Verrucomicrobiota bacterium]